MPQFVDVRIQIDGKELTPVTSFHISQSIYQHHTFRIICPAETVDDPNSAILHSSQNLIGSTVTIQSTDPYNHEKVDLSFSGVITQVEAVRHPGDIGQLVL